MLIYFEMVNSRQCSEEKLLITRQWCFSVKITLNLSQLRSLLKDSLKDKAGHMARALPSKKACLALLQSLPSHFMNLCLK